ncbi:MAG: flagellar assembly protein FliW [Magnetococcales bacterium]|nr:flagellar assembly protein FliW [Magnetococcales bacterium]NGZ25602.1 flagellar assembly protein FliW [Magnetococcales bacterium]
MKIQLQTKHSGLVEVDEEAVFTFPRGVPGFENCQKFALFLVEEESSRPRGDAPRVFWLQSLDDPEVVFNVVDASEAGIAYQLMLEEDEMRTLEIDENTGEDTIGTLLVLSRKAMVENIRLPLFALSGGKIKPNLQGPIFVNMQKRLAFQKALLRMEITINILGR